MTKVLLVMAGGSIGALSRYGVSLLNYVANNLLGMVLVFLGMWVARVK